MKVGIDVGGTFTDFLVTDPGGRTQVGKVLSTPEDPAIGLLRGLEEIAAERGMSLADFAMLGGFGQGGRPMRIARLERDGRAAGGEDVEVVGCVAVIVAESYRRYLDNKKEDREPERDLTLETVWIR